MPVCDRVMTASEDQMSSRVILFLTGRCGDWSLWRIVPSTQRNFCRKTPPGGNYVWPRGGCKFVCCIDWIVVMVYRVMWCLGFTWVVFPQVSIHLKRNLSLQQIYIGWFSEELHCSITFNTIYISPKTHLLQSLTCNGDFSGPCAFWWLDQVFFSSNILKCSQCFVSEWTTFPPPSFFWRGDFFQ